MTIRDAQVVVLDPCRPVPRLALEACLALGARVIAAGALRTELSELYAELRQHERLFVADCDCDDPFALRRLLDEIARDGAPLALCAAAFDAAQLARRSELLRDVLRGCEGRAVLLASPAAWAAWAAWPAREDGAAAIAGVLADPPRPSAAWLPRLLQLLDPARPAEHGWAGREAPVGLPSKG